MIGAIIFTLLAIALWLVYAYKTCVNWRHSSALPPEAPGARPFVGHYFAFGSGELEVPTRKLAKMAEDQQGSAAGTDSPGLVTVKMGFRNMVVVNDFRTALAATKGGGFDAKPLTLAKVVTRGGVVNTEGESWAVNRKFCARKLRDAGFGCHATEELCLSEVKDYLVKLKERSSSPYDFRLELQESIANVIGTTLVGPGFRKKNMAFDLPDISSVMAPFCPADPRSVAPELRFMNMLARTTAIPKLIVAHSRFKRYIQSLVDEARQAAKDGASGNAGLHGGGLIGAYLAEQERLAKCRPSSTRLTGMCKRQSASSIGDHRTSATSRKASLSAGVTSVDVEAQAEKQLKEHWDEHLLIAAGPSHVHSVTSDILVNGVDKLTSALSWVLYVLCRHQDVQLRIFNEIRAVVGTNTSRLPRFEEKEQLPYTRAVLSEVARLYPAVPATIVCSLDKTKKTERLATYEIPRGTPVYVNIWAALRDPRVWTANADEFRPERFLDHDGHFRLSLSQPYCPFGIGRRTCLGESLALQLIFIFTTAILHTYEVAFANSNANPQHGEDPNILVEEGELNFTYSPRPFKLLLTKRPFVTSD